MTSFSPILRFLVVALVGFLFIAHFAVTAIYLTPLNPVKLKLSPLLQAWINPLFSQNWHLFAPDPLSSNHSLVTKCKSGTTTSDWIDVTRAVLKRYYENRLSTAKAIAGIQVNALISVATGGAPIEEPAFRKFCRDRDQDQENAFCSQLEEYALGEFERAQRILVSMATEGCEQFMEGMRVDEVFVRVTQLDFPRFSERYKPDRDGKAFIIDLGWHPVTQK